MSGLPDDANKWMKYLGDIEKHLGKNENWLKYPERKAKRLESEMAGWNKQMEKEIVQLENATKSMWEKIEE